MSRSFVIYSKTKRPKLNYPENTTDYVDYQVHQVKKSTGDGIDDFEVIDEVEEIKTNIDEFINSYKDDVGIENIMKRIAATGDMSLLNQKEAIHMDTTIIPDDPGEAFALSQSVEELYSKIDPALTEGKSMKEFLESLSDEKISSYIEAKVKASMEEKK